MRPFTVAYTGDFRGGGRAAHRRSGHRPARPAPVAALPVPRRPGPRPPATTATRTGSTTWRSRPTASGPTTRSSPARASPRSSSAIARTMRGRSTEANPGGPGRAVDRGATEYYPAAREFLVAVKSSISLTDEQHAFARALVEAGRYASLSAVLQQGVDLLRQRLDAQELEHAAMRELLSRRRQGEFVSGQRMDTRLARMIADKRRAHGLQS